MQTTTFNLSVLSHFVAQQGNISGGATVTDQYGFLANNELTNATNNYGFFGNIPNGTNRWNIYMNGTADNYLRGKLLINTNTVGTFNLDVNGTARVSGNMDFGTTTTNPTINFAASANASAAQFVINNSAFGGTIYTIRNAADSRYFRISGVNFDVSLTGTIFSPNGTFGNINIASTIITGFNTSALNLNGDTVIFNSRTGTASLIRILSGSATATSKGTVYISDYSNLSTSYSASAQLQVDSTVQGFLPPRMTTTQKNAIGTPAAGLQVYDTTLNQMSYYNGTTWVNF
jgi:hypothetical protein